MFKAYFVSLIFIITTLFASASWSLAVNVKLEVKGLEADQNKALLNSISLYRLHGSKSLSKEYIRSLYLKGIEEIKQGVQELGYFKAKVDANLDEKADPWQANYVVSLGPAMTIKIELQAKGLNAEQENALRNSISLYRLQESKFLTPEYIRSLYLKGIDEIKKSVQVLGYFKAKVESNLDEDSKPWQAKYAVSLGPAMFVNLVDLQITGEGEKDELLRRWKKDYPLKQGEILDQQVYESAKKNLLILLRERGYLKAAVQLSEIKVSLQNYNSQIRMHIDTGPRFKFGPVIFSQDAFSTSFLSRFVPFTEGQYFDNNSLVELQENLTLSNEFTHIEISPQLEHTENKTIPVDVVLNARKPWNYSLGLGYGTDTGPRTRVKVERRQISQTGQNADSEIYYSQIKKSFTLNYRFPLTNPVTDKLVLTGVRKEEDSDTAYSESKSFVISRIHIFDRWERTASISYLSEAYEVGSEQDKSKLVIPELSFNYLPDIKWQNKTKHKDDILKWRFNASLKGADKDMGSDVSYLQAKAFLGNRFRFFEGWYLESRLDVGWTWADEFTVLPVSQRFFAGGDFSVRGYSYKSLGPVDETGEVVGGNRLLVGSMEVQYKFNPKWDVAAFYDAGNAFNDGEFIPEQTTGFGLGWQLPIAILRVYAAYGVTEPGFRRIHLVMSAEW